MAHRLLLPARSLLAGGCGVSRFSHMEFLCMPGVFDSAGSRLARVFASARCCLPCCLTPSAPRNTRFRSSIPSLQIPLSNASIQVQPRDCPRMARGQGGSLFLPCTTLAFATPRRFIPTLSRPGGLPHEFCRITHTGKSMRHCAKACATRGQEASTRPAPVSPQRGRGRTLHRAPCARARRRTPSPISPPR